MRLAFPVREVKPRLTRVNAKGWGEQDTIPRTLVRGGAEPARRSARSRDP